MVVSIPSSNSARIRHRPRGLLGCLELLFLGLAAAVVASACNHRPACGPGYERTAVGCDPIPCPMACGAGGGECLVANICTCRSPGYSYDAQNGCTVASTACGTACGSNSTCMQAIDDTARCFCNVGFSAGGNGCIPTRISGDDCVVPTAGMLASRYGLCGRFSTVSAPENGSDVNNSFDLRGTVSTQPQTLDVPTSNTTYRLSLRKL